jgi:hypothetical protein
VRLLFCSAYGALQYADASQTTVAEVLTRFGVRKIRQRLSLPVQRATPQNLAPFMQARC